MDVNMEQLTEIITVVRENIKAQPDYDKFNEARTREALVAPVLRVMGWNVADFTLVDVEYSVHGGEGRRKVDYALWPPAYPRKSQGHKPFTLLETKGVDEEIDKDAVIRSIRDYAFEAGVPKVILTNGKIWRYHVFPSPVLTDHYQGMPQVDIYSAENSSSDCAKALTSMFEKVLAAPIDHHLTSGWVSLEDYLRPRSRNRPRPKALRFPDGDEHEVNHIRDLMKVTADWLLARGLLTAAQCPIAGGRNRTKLLVSTDSSLEELASWEAIGTSGLFVRIGERGNAADVPALLEGCGQSPADLYVQVAR